MKCPRCRKADLVVELVFTGGCQGHSGEGDYCYCDYPDAHIELKCPSSRIRCHSFSLRVPGLADKAGIERWIAAHLEEPVKSPEG